MRTAPYVETGATDYVNLAVWGGGLFEFQTGAAPRLLVCKLHLTLVSRQFIRKQQSDFGWDWGPA